MSGRRQRVEAGRSARTVGTTVDESRQALRNGSSEAAAGIIEAAMRRGGMWMHRRMWAELLTAMSRPSDYARIRSLWIASPPACHGRVPIVRIVARAASVAGHHDEARALLRKAILLSARHRVRLRRALGRVGRRVLARTLAGARAPSGEVGFAARAATALTDLDRDLDDLGVRPFLISGTLLGCWRESGFISWDKDIDVGFFTDDARPADLERAFHCSPRFTVRRLDFNADRLRVRHVNGVMIDIFPHYEEDGLLWHDGTATRWWNTPFKLTSVEFLGQSRLVPDPPDQYLDENYGDWRVPQPDFDARLDTPNGEVTDHDYFETLLYFSLLDALGAGRVRRQRRYARLLAERGQGTWLDRVAKGALPEIRWSEG